MSLSISSSSGFFKVVIGVIAVLLVAELGVRKFVLPRSESSGVIREVQRRGRDLRDGDFNVVVFGNSYTLNGINTENVKSAARKASHDRALDLEIHAIHGSYICEWYWLVKRWYLSSDIRPDVIVLNVGETSLLDRDEIDHRRLALGFGTQNPLSIPVADLGKNKKIVEFVVSRYSMLINRGRNIGDQIKLNLIPNFGSVNALLRGRRSLEVVGTTPSTGLTVDVFARFLDDCNVSGVKVVVVLMPQREFYQLNQHLWDLFAVSSEWVSVIDHRGFGVLERKDFEDDVHMNAKGQSKYSPFYSGELIDELLRLDGAKTFARTQRK